MEKKFGIECTYNYTDNVLTFSTYDKINDSIDLEKLDNNDFFLFLKVTFSNNEKKYYTFENSSNYTNLTYYTITKNNSNNKIDIAFNQYNNIPCLQLDITKVDYLPDDVYDIAIDPGHGGKDLGAKEKEYTESELTLKYSQDLKSKLENLGLKVFISRDGSESSKEDMANNMYEDTGRINILNESKAKLMLSIHLNDNNYKKNTGGVEVYAPSNCNLSFASNLSKNIVENASTNYSELNTFKKADGVYVRNFTNADITAFNTRAKKGNYEPYQITSSTPYLYIIREIGGINTSAFVDGGNKYWNSNYGIEGYSIELGYMHIENDLNNIVTNYELYTSAICNTIASFYNLNT